MTLRVIKPGLLTTLQDRGRRGYQHYGVAVGGAADEAALRMANWLVGNPDHLPVLEITALGPVLEFQADGVVAVCGGDLTPVVDQAVMPMWRPVWVRKGSRLRFGAAQSGYRAYLAAAGGFAARAVMGSASTDVRTGFGGMDGRALKSGDILRLGEPEQPARGLLHRLAGIHAASREPMVSVPWSISVYTSASYVHQPFVHAMEGLEYERFTDDSKARFFTRSYRVEPQSDRMGCRLSGPELGLSEQREMLSEAVSYGTVQVPPQGRPIVLMADSPTTGGYPRIAHVVRTDLPVLAQLKPGDWIQFRKVTANEAHERYRLRERELLRLRAAIRLKLESMGRTPAN